MLNAKINSNQNQTRTWYYKAKELSLGSTLQCSTSWYILNYCYMSMLAFYLANKYSYLR